MAPYLQAAAGVLLAVIICIALEKNGSGMQVLLCTAVCCLGGGILLHYLEPVLDLLAKLHLQTGLDGEFLKIMLKITGIGLLGELSALICVDAGNGALGKLIQLISSAAILWLSIPLFGELMELIETILGEI